jgi:uncharacterized protein (DUF427 family)
MTTATWKSAVIAQSDDIVTVEGNAYFPPDSITPDMLEDSTTTSVCPWKGTARYKTVVVGDQRNVDAAWYYPDPKSAAAEIKDRIAFWKGVTVS